MVDEGSRWKTGAARAHSVSRWVSRAGGALHLPSNDAEATSGGPEDKAAGTAAAVLAGDSSWSFGLVLASRMWSAVAPLLHGATDVVTGVGRRV